MKDESVARIPMGKSVLAKTRLLRRFSGGRLCGGALPGKRELEQLYAV